MFLKQIEKTRKYIAELDAIIEAEKPLESKKRKAIEAWIINIWNMRNTTASVHPYLITEYPVEYRDLVETHDYLIELLKLF